MGVLSNTQVVNPFLDWLVGNANMAASATRYITIFTGDPTSGGSEVINTVTGSANRQDMTTGMAAAAAGSVTNDALITFTASAVGAATVNYLAVYDAITGGNLLASVAITPKSVAIGDGLRISIGALTFAVT